MEVKTSPWTTFDYLKWLYLAKLVLGGTISVTNSGIVVAIISHLGLLPSIKLETRAYIKMQVALLVKEFRHRAEDS